MKEFFIGITVAAVFGFNLYVNYQNGEKISQLNTRLTIIEQKYDAYKALAQINQDINSFIPEFVPIDLEGEIKSETVTGE